MTLEGKVALVAGATRGAGRGIAVELGAAGATVYVTGRTTRDQQSEYGRPETIEETAELVSAAGGTGIAVQVDHLVADDVRALVERIRAEQGRLDVLVNDIWGGEKLFEWNKPVWEHDLAERPAHAAARHRHPSDHRASCPAAPDRASGRPARRGDRRHGRIQCRALPPLAVLRSRQGGGDPHGLGACQGPRAARRDLGRRSRPAGCARR